MSHFNLVGIGFAVNVMRLSGVAQVNTEHLREGSETKVKDFTSEFLSVTEKPDRALRA